MLAEYVIEQKSEKRSEVLFYWESSYKSIPVNDQLEKYGPIIGNVLDRILDG